MWRPVALSAFLALLFMSARSGQEPVQVKVNETAKTDLGAGESASSAENVPVEFDSARSSAHPKAVQPGPNAAGERAEAQTAKTGTGKGEHAAEPVAVASAEGIFSETIPLPAPKSDPDAVGTRVVVTQGEQKTALTTDEEALRLMPPGPDFAAKVQRELARLGCYQGRIDNVWGPMSRNAVARLNRVAKSKLPLKQPTRALLSSARKAPAGYCSGTNSGGAQVAALDPGAGLEALKNRPEYLPPWMRGEPMPEPGENRVEAQEEPEASPQNTPAATRTRRAKPERTQRKRARTRQVRRRTYRRRTRSVGSSIVSNGGFWPGQ